MKTLLKFAFLLIVMSVSSSLFAQDTKKQTTAEPKKNTTTQKDRNAETQPVTTTDEATVKEKKVDKTQKKDGTSSPSNMAISEQGTRKKEKPQAAVNTPVQPTVMDAATEVERQLDSLNVGGKVDQ